MVTSIYKYGYVHEDSETITDQKLVDRLQPLDSSRNVDMFIKQNICKLLKLGEDLDNYFLVDEEYDETVRGYVSIEGTERKLTIEEV